MQHRDRAIVFGHVIDVGRHHHRRDEQNLRSGAGGVREIPAQPEHLRCLDHVERRRLGSGVESAETQHLEAVLRGGENPVHRGADVGQCG